MLERFLKTGQMKELPAAVKRNSQGIPPPTPPPTGVSVPRGPAASLGSCPGGARAHPPRWDFLNGRVFLARASWLPVPAGCGGVSRPREASAGWGKVTP